MSGKMKAVSVYLTERECDALAHIKRKSFDQGRTVSISGMVREVLTDTIIREKQADPIVSDLLAGKYDGV